MLEETKALLRNAIAEAMSKAWDQAAAELMEMLNPSPMPVQLRLVAPEPSPEGNEAKTALYFMQLFEERFLPGLRRRSQTLFKAVDFMDWVESEESGVTLNAADLRHPPSGRPDWRSRVNTALGILIERERIYRKPGTKYIYSTVKPAE